MYMSDVRVCVCICAGDGIMTNDHVYCGWFSNTNNAIVSSLPAPHTAHTLHIASERAPFIQHSRSRAFSRQWARELGESQYRFVCSQAYWIFLNFSAEKWDRICEMAMAGDESYVEEVDCRSTISRSNMCTLLNRIPILLIISDFIQAYYNLERHCDGISFEL